MRELTTIRSLDVTMGLCQQSMVRFYLGEQSPEAERQWHGTYRLLMAARLRLMEHPNGDADEVEHLGLAAVNRDEAVALLEQIAVAEHAHWNDDSFNERAIHMAQDALRNAK